MDETTRKRRTREHVIADMSRVFVEWHIIHAGHTARRVIDDYGYDLVVRTYNMLGEVENGESYIQLKATDNLERYETKNGLSFPIDRADYEFWVNERYPVYLVLYDARKQQGYWCYIQSFYSQNPTKDMVQNYFPDSMAFSPALTEG